MIPLSFKLLSFLGAKETPEETFKEYTQLCFTKDNNFDICRHELKKTEFYSVIENFSGQIS